MSRLRHILLKWAIGLGSAAAALLGGSAAAATDVAGWSRGPAVDPAESIAAPRFSPMTLTSAASDPAGDAAFSCEDFGVNTGSAGPSGAAVGSPQYTVPLEDLCFGCGDAFGVSFVPGAGIDTVKEAQPLTPVPEPAGATALAALVVVGLLRRGRRGCG